MPENAIELEHVSPELESALAAAEAAEGAEVKTGGSEADQPTRQPELNDALKGDQPDSVSTQGTSATVEPKDQSTPPQDKVETQKQDNRSDFSKNSERLDKTWKAVNQRKTDLDTKEQTLTQREQAIAQREQRLEEQRVKAQSSTTPEQFEQWSGKAQDLAQSYELQAKGAEKQAEEFEEAGKYAEANQARARAQELREAAIVQKHQANQAKAQAKYLRDNPDPTAKQVQERIEGQRRQWTMKAAQQWPEFAKDGSEFQKVVAGHLKALEQTAPELLDFPGIVYHVARLTAAETAAARVPAMEKELGEAKARVKELELLTTPGGGQGSVQRPPDNRPANDEEEAAALRAEAARNL